MIAIGHTSVGVLVGVVAIELGGAMLPLPLLLGATFAAGVASHYVMDLVPHGHYNFDARHITARSGILLLLDVGVPIAAFLIFTLLVVHNFSAPLWSIMAGIAGAQAPDIFDGILGTGKVATNSIFEKETSFHQWTHWHNPTDIAKATVEGGKKLDLWDVWQVMVIFLGIWSVSQLG
jgi:hypothetical protein